MEDKYVLSNVWHYALQYIIISVNVVNKSSYLLSYKYMHARNYLYWMILNLYTVNYCQYIVT